MRIIETEIINALHQRHNFGTSPLVNNYYGNNPNGRKQRRDLLRWTEYDTFRYELWGHAIAEGDMVTNKLSVSDCGYATSTTKSRLNAIFAALDIPMSCTVRKKKMIYFLNGKELELVEKTIDYRKDYTIATGHWVITIS